MLFGDFQGENFSPLGPLWVVLVTTKFVCPRKGRKEFIMMNANIAVADLLALEERVEDLRLKGEILYSLFGKLEGESVEEVDVKLHQVAMDLVREEVTLGIGYVDLYKIYRDCENDEAKNNTFAHYLNYVREEVTYELLYRMALKEAKVLEEAIEPKEFSQLTFNEVLRDIDIRSEYLADFPEEYVSIDGYFWEVIGR